MRKRKGNSRQGAVRALLCAALIVCISGAAYLCSLAVEEYQDRRQGIDFYQSLLEESSRTGVSTPEHTQSGALSAEGLSAMEGNTDLLGEPEMCSELDFEALQGRYPDIVGWIRQNDTVIDYPIMQGEDNEYYLHHLPDGTPRACGSIMMDKSNDSLLTDDVIILHGHHMNNGSMFATLDHYKREAYYLEHPYFRLLTPQGDFDVAIFAAYEVNGDTFGYPITFADEEEFDRFVSEAVQQTRFTTDVDVAYGDRVLLLSTCSYSFHGARYVVMGKILDGHADDEKNRIVTE